MHRRLRCIRPPGITDPFNVAGHEGYLNVGLYEDGQPGELFITMSKEGSTIGGLMDSLGTATSVALQYGVPISSLVAKFSHQRFEPAGMTENREIPFAKSLVDYIFRWMGMQFIPGYREANAPNYGGTSAEPAVMGRAAAVIDRARHSVSDHDHGHAGHAAHAPVEVKAQTRVQAGETALSATLSVAMESMGDAPACDTCGTITVRSGTCYKCLNCGASMGCS